MVLITLINLLITFLKDLNTFKVSTPCSSLGNSNLAKDGQEQSNLNEAIQLKIVKVSASSFDYVAVLEAIKASPSLCIKDFDMQKDDAKTWIGRLENAIVAVDGDINQHGFGVISILLDTDASEWLFEFRLEKPTVTWHEFSVEFVKHFDEKYAKNFKETFVDIKSSDDPVVYAKKRMETWKKFLPYIKQSDLNMIVAAGFSATKMNHLKNHKHTKEEDNFINLCKKIHKKDLN